MEVFHVLASFVIAASSLAYLFLRKRFSYWADRGILHDKPVLFYGNLRKFGRSEPLFKPFREFYLKYKGKAPFGGFYLFLRRAVVVLDLELVKNVLIKDFQYFSHRGQYYNERDDPLTGHIFNLDGPKWKSLRAKLTPTFTSGKMKFMFPAILKVAEKFVKILNDLHSDFQNNQSNVESETEWNVEVRELLARFTTDVIGNCAFGLECNSLKDPQTKFRLMGQKVFTKRRHGMVVFAFMQAFPDLARKLGIKAIPDDVSDFFLNVVRDTVEYREKNNIKRNDFLNLLIDLKNQDETNGLSLEEIAAQAFVFFLAGFETSSSTMSFTLYELALNQDIQNKARQEINDMLNKYNGEFIYDGMRELKYLQQILHESLRKHSIAAIVSRKTVKDYKVPNIDFVIEKGTIVVIPIDGIHHDPEIYPNPDIFDPDRFAPGEAEKRNSIAWLPFGEGPRNCIGWRFGEMQAIVGLALLLKNFRFSIGKKTRVPLEIDVKNIILSAKGGITLKMEPI